VQWTPAKVLDTHVWAIATKYINKISLDQMGLSCVLRDELGDHHGIKLIL